MKKISLIAFFLIVYSSYGFSQTNENIDSLICKEWKIQYMETGGKRMELLPENKNETMVFYTDHKYKFSGGLGIWQYDPVNKLIGLVDNQGGVIGFMKILEITNEKCVFQDPDEPNIKIHMTASKK